MNHKGQLLHTIYAYNLMKSTHKSVLMVTRHKFKKIFTPIIMTQLSFSSMTKKWNCSTVAKSVKCGLDNFFGGDKVHIFFLMKTHGESNK